MSIYRAALNNTLDLTLVSDDKLSDLLAELEEHGWELSYEAPAYEPGELDGLFAQIKSAIGRVNGELNARCRAELDAEAEQLAFEDGRHTLVG